MKKIFAIIALALTCASVGQAQSKNEFKVRVNVKNYVTDTINLVYFENEKIVRHSIAIKDNKGEVTINASKYTPLTIITRDKNNNIPVGRGIIPGPAISIYSEGDKDIEVAIDHNKWPVCQVKGGVINNDNNRLIQKTFPLKREEFELLRKCHTEGVSESDKAAMEKKIGTIKDEISTIEQQFVLDNSSSYIALRLLAGERNSFELKEFDRRFNLLNKELRTLPIGIEIAKYISAKKATTVGSKAPQFEKKDRDGKVIKSSDFAGKYVLIDFWGTWCGPCRSSHPHLAQLHQKYSPEGLVFINVAQENGANSRALWLKAVEEDKLVWTQILNNEGIDSCDMVKLFAISAFPTKVLISPEGTIVGTYVGDSAEIDKKLVEIFKK